MLMPQEHRGFQMKCSELLGTSSLRRGDTLRARHFQRSDLPGLRAELEDGLHLGRIYVTCPKTSIETQSVDLTSLSTCMSRTAKGVTWNGKDVPTELRDLPAGRYVVEAC